MQDSASSGIDSQEPVIDWEEFFLMFWRHRGLILLCGTIGVVAAIVLISVSSVYQSQAKVFVRYVQESSVVDALDRNGRDLEKPNSSGRGSVVLNNEIEILTSADLAEEVALALGSERIASRAHAGSLPQSSVSWIKKQLLTTDDSANPENPVFLKKAANTGVLKNISIWMETQGKQETDSQEPVTPQMAASMIRQGLEVTTRKESSVIHVCYRNPEPEIAQRVLEELISRYFDKHLEIHRPGGAEFAEEQTEGVEKWLQEIENEINQVMKESGIISTDVSLELLEKQRSQLRGDLIMVEAELASVQARTKSLEPVLAAHDRDSGSESHETEPSDSDVRRYQALLDLVAQLRKRNLDLICTFTPKSQLIATNTRRLDAAESERLGLAEKFPLLVSQTSPTRDGAANSVPRIDIDVELANLAALQARKGLLQESLRSYEEYASTLPSSISRIRTLERQKKQAEDDFFYFREAQKRAQVEASLDPSRMPNLTIVQHPSQPEKVRPSRTKYVALALAGSGLGAGVVLALWIELFVNRRVRRPEEFGRRLGIPLSLSIPFVSGVGGRRGTVELRRYARNILDLLSHEWRSNGAPRGPRLVAVTGAGQGTGTSTLTGCLFECLRDQGEKVLVVNPRSLQNDLAHLCEPEEEMDVRGEKGNSGPGITLREALQKMNVRGETRKSRQVSWESLSIRQLGTLLSNLQATDYDYVLIDMSLVGPGIPTRSIVRSLHKVLLITSPDRTDCDVLVNAFDVLIEAGADISCIFNKVPPADCRTPLARDMQPKLGSVNGANGAWKHPDPAQLRTS